MIIITLSIYRENSVSCVVQIYSMGSILNSSSLSFSLSFSISRKSSFVNSGGWDWCNSFVVEWSTSSHVVDLVTSLISYREFESSFWGKKLLKEEKSDQTLFKLLSHGMVKSLQSAYNNSNSILDAVNLLKYFNRNLILDACIIYKLEKYFVQIIALKSSNATLVYWID